MAVPPDSAPTYPGSPRPQIRFDVIGEAWRMFQPNMGTWIVAELLFVVVVAIAGVVGGVGFMITAGITAAIARAIPIGILAFPLSFAIPIIIVMVAGLTMLGGMYRMAIRQLQGESVQATDIFKVQDVMGPLVVGSLLSGIAIYIGMLFCYLPGIIIAGLLMFTIPLIVDKRMAPVDAMKLSFETLKPDLVMAALFFFVVELVGGIGGAACGIGALFTYPLFFLSISLLYRDFFLTAGGPAPYAPAPSAAVDVPAPSPPPAPPVTEAAPPVVEEETVVPPPPDTPAT